MYKTKAHKTLLLILIVLLSSAVNAREYGINVYYTTLSIDDADGSTEKVNQLSPLNIYYADKLSFDTRYWTEMYYNYASLTATSKNIGQDVSIYGFSGAWQKRFIVSNEIKPWLGVGLSYAMVNRKDRHTMDQDGFLKNNYSDQRDNNVDLYFVASNHWKVNNQWDVGAVTRLIPPLIGDVMLMSVGISVSYH